MGQVDGPQEGSLHTPAAQTRGGLWPAQLTQSWPPAPHAVLCVPTAQMSPKQHPTHVLGSQSPDAGTHAPLGLQASFGPHVVHACPAAPHAAGLVTVTHWSPIQQPAQLVESHFAPPHARVASSHARPSAAQSAHCAPPLPHAAASVPVEQRSRPSSKVQQPSQVEGLHAASSRAHTRDLVQRS